MRGMGNMNNMMKQMQKMQKKMMEAQEELSAQIFEGTASNGLVKVVMNGQKQVQEVIINPEVVDPEDVEMLQDMVVIATNAAIAKVDETTNATMGQFTKGINLPGF